MLLSEVLWTIPIFSWTAGGQIPWCTMLLSLVWRVYEQNLSEWANGLHRPILRQWHWSGHSVRYIGSEFLGHATAADLLTHFKDGIRGLEATTPWMCQVSVNWKFYTVLAREFKTQELPNLWTSAAEKSWKQFKLSWKSHGRVMELYYQISVGTL